MSVERRGQAIRVMVNLANWQQEEPTGCGGGRQLSLDGTSRVTGDSHARFCERLGVKFPGPTRRCHCDYRVAGRRGVVRGWGLEVIEGMGNINLKSWWRFYRPSFGHARGGRGAGLPDRDIPGRLPVGRGFATGIECAVRPPRWASYR